MNGKIIIQFESAIGNLNLALLSSMRKFARLFTTADFKMKIKILNYSQMERERAGKVIVFVLQFSKSYLVVFRKISNNGNHVKRPLSLN